MIRLVARVIHLDHTWYSDQLAYDNYREGFLRGLNMTP